MRLQEVFAKEEAYDDIKKKTQCSTCTASISNSQRFKPVRQLRISRSTKRLLIPQAEARDQDSHQLDGIWMPPLC